LPASASSVVGNGAIGLLCGKLTSIEYIDVAEQAIQCLEKISYEHGAALVQSKGLSAVLGFLDFFSISSQRIAISIAANSCRSIPETSFSFVLDVLPLLSNLLLYEDPKSK
jgi:E3 ubiquitin-protein ligase TRIP12